MIDGILGISAIYIQRASVLRCARGALSHVTVGIFLPCGRITGLFEFGC